jgi:hypothetical protein
MRGLVGRGRVGSALHCVALHCTGLRPCNAQHAFHGARIHESVATL